MLTETESVTFARSASANRMQNLRCIFIKPVLYSLACWIVFPGIYQQFDQHRNNEMDGIPERDTGWRGMIGQYTKSLKGFVTEELISLLAYRPVGYLLLLPIKKTSISPNQITVFKLVLSVVGAFCLFFYSLLWGGVLLLLSNILDHVDGQLARVKGLSSTLGKALDDASDYITFILYYFLATLALIKATGMPTMFFLGLAAGISSFFQTVIYDVYLNSYAKNAPADELREEQDSYLALVKETNFGSKRRVRARLWETPGEKKDPSGVEPQQDVCGMPVWGCVCLFNGGCVSGGGGCLFSSAGDCREPDHRGVFPDRGSGGLKG